LIRIGQILPINDTSQIAPARRTATHCAETLRLGATAAGKAALVATELATNILKHGDGGSLLIGTSDDPTALVLVSIDRGRGIGNVQAAMADGFSTAGSPGTGLGAITRNVSAYDLYTQADRGTAILCRIDAEGPRPAFTARRFAIGGVCLPKPGEDQSGDSWTASMTREYIDVAVADGLGHGILAATASSTAVRVIAANAKKKLEHIYEETHGALRSTRGAAVGIARVGHNRVEFAGVGNIAGTIAGDDATRRMVSLNGIVGHEMRRVQSYSYPWSEHAVLILASDGISTSWNLNNYPGLLQHDPAIIAAVLYRDHSRGNDDSTVVVLKNV